MLSSSVILGALKRPGTLLQPADPGGAVRTLGFALGAPPPGWEIRELPRANGTAVFAAYAPGETLVFTLPARDAAVRAAYRLAAGA